MSLKLLLYALAACYYDCELKAFPPLTCPLIADPTRYRCACPCGFDNAKGGRARMRKLVYHRNPETITLFDQCEDVIGVWGLMLDTIHLLLYYVLYPTYGGR
jgi:hypothetical protein